MPSQVVVSIHRVGCTYCHVGFLQHKLCHYLFSLDCHIQCQLLFCMFSAPDTHTIYPYAMYTGIQFSPVLWWCFDVYFLIWYHHFTALILFHTHWIQCSNIYIYNYTHILLIPMASYHIGLIRLHTHVYHFSIGLEVSLFQCNSIWQIYSDYKMQQYIL